MSPSSSATTGWKWRGRNRANAATRDASVARARDRRPDVLRLVAETGTGSATSTRPRRRRRDRRRPIGCGRRRSTTLSIPEAQLRLTVNAGTFTGIFASSAITRATLAASAGSGDVADDDLVERLGIDLRALDRLADRDAAELDGADPPKQRAGLDERRARSGHDDDVAISDHASRPFPGGCRTSRASCRGWTAACRSPWPWPRMFQSCSSSLAMMNARSAASLNSWSVAAAARRSGSGRDPSAGARPKPAGMSRGANASSRRHDHEALDRVSQLADVAAPRKPESASIASGATIFGLSPCLGAERLARTKRRARRRPRGARAAAEAGSARRSAGRTDPRGSGPRAISSSRSLVGRRDDADVHDERLGGAHRLDLAVLQRPQDLGLRPQAHVRRPRRGRSSRRRPARTSRSGRGAAPGERALVVAEQLGLDQLLGDRGAVDLDERLARARAVPMDGARDQLLAGSRFPGDEHRGRRRAPRSAIWSATAFIAGEAPIMLETAPRT